MSQEIVILNESGKPILVEYDGLIYPENYTFECINNFVHAESPQYEDLQNLALGMVNRIEELEGAIRNLHKVRSRHHTQQACESLFALVGLDNNIGAKNDS